MEPHDFDPLTGLPRQAASTTMTPAMQKAYQDALNRTAPPPGQAAQINATVQGNQQAPQFDPSTGRPLNDAAMAAQAHRVLEEQAAVEAPQTLEQKMGELYPQYLQFTNVHSYLGIPYAEMTREDLFATIGVLLSDVYTLTAMSPGERAAISPADAGLSFAKSPTNQG